jgi:DNA-binding CsgD family transcriptional regulator
MEVLRLLAAGRTNREIAVTLFISVHTVNAHVKTILGKTGSANRVEAAAFAHAHHLI